MSRWKATETGAGVTKPLVLRSLQAEPCGFFAQPLLFGSRRCSRIVMSAVGPQDVWRWANSYRLRGRRHDKMSDEYRTGVP